MHHYLQTAKTFTATHKKQFGIGVGLVAAIALIVGFILYSILNNPRRVVYQPTNACDLFTITEGHELLGKNVINHVQEPDITGDTAISNCTYSDTNPNQDEMKVAAIVVRSGVNDFGVKQNQTDFAKKMALTNGQAVKGLGDSAYFAPQVGQLNVLKGRNWFIMSNGVGSAPQANTLDDAIALAHKVLN